MSVFIQRIKESDEGTLGWLHLPGGVILATLEEEDLDNGKGSRIPAGEYECVRTQYYGGGYATHEVTGVPGRSRILFHIGNTEENTSGCILLGMSHGKLRVRDEESGEQRMKMAILSSKKAFKNYWSLMEHRARYTLRIHDVDPTEPEPHIQLVDSINEV